jgi:fructose-1,6-bisphosphatase/inositol monophosphatase family enzyme
VKLSKQDLQALRATASDAARVAGDYIAQARPEQIDWKPGITSRASQIVTEVDRRAEELIVSRLSPAMASFDIGLLTEEREDDSSRHDKDHFWCIDPLDGTLPFVNGESGYAVSIALVSKSGEPLVGAIYIPARGRLYGAARGLGVIADDTPWTRPQPSSDDLLVCVDGSFEGREQLIAGLDGRGYGRARVRTFGGAVVLLPQASQARGRWRQYLGLCRQRQFVHRSRRNRHRHPRPAARPQSR